MRFFPNLFQDFVPGTRVHIDKEHWVNQVSQIAESVVQGMPATHDNCDGGLYVGNAGIAYMFYWLSQNDAFKDMRPAYLEHAIAYAKVSQEYVKNANRDQASFILGEAGVHAISCLIRQAAGDANTADKFAQKYAKLADICLPMNFLRCGSDELFVGRAGYLCGVLNLSKQLGKQIVSESVVHQICSIMVDSGRKRAKKDPPIPLMYAYYDTEYLGAAHGLSSILQMLLSFPSFLKANKEAEQTVHAAVDFMLTLEQDNFNYPPAMDEVKHRRPDKEELVHWCHGAPGIVYMLARAYKVWGDQRYLDACLRCGELTWQRGLLKKGPGICHGVSGSGYVFLLLYRLTGDQKHLHRALKFAEFMFSEEFQQARIPDSPYSLYEGWGGAVCFLSDLLQPDKAEFPFFNVFVD